MDKPRLVFVDVGAAYGLVEPWKSIRDELDVTLIEPSSRDALWLRQNMPEGTRIVEAALYDRDGDCTLHITRGRGSSSILTPDEEMLRHYKVAPIFDVVETETVRCVRYDTLVRAGEVPSPDALKIDVQGVEYEVLEGCGDALDGCLAIMLEAHIYPIYRGQKLLHDIVGLLARRGLYLRGIVPHRTFDAELVELDAVFLRRKQGLGETAAAKLVRLETILRVTEYPQGAELAARFAVE